jgi:pentatricopeptide repeat protein
VRAGNKIHLPNSAARPAFLSSWKDDTRRERCPFLIISIVTIKIYSMTLHTTRVLQTSPVRGSVTWHSLRRTCRHAHPAGLWPSTVAHSSEGMAPTASSVSTEDRDVRDVRVEVTRRIKALGRQGKVKDAIKELANMARMGVEPDTLSATALIDACVRSNKMDMAENVFEELFGELLSPDEVAFMVLIRGYGEQYPPQWTQIASTLSVMEHTYGVEPTVLTFNTLLEICSKSNDEERGMEIIDRMDDQAVVPNDGSFEAVKNRKSLRGRLKKLL